MSFSGEWMEGVENHFVKRNKPHPEQIAHVSSHMWNPELKVQNKTKART
jgi:hypothetical protein